MGELIPISFLPEPLASSVLMNTLIQITPCFITCLLSCPLTFLPGISSIQQLSYDLLGRRGRGEGTVDEKIEKTADDFHFPTHTILVTLNSTSTRLCLQQDAPGQKKKKKI